MHSGKMYIRHLFRYGQLLSSFTIIIDNESTNSNSALKRQSWQTTISFLPSGKLKPVQQMRNSPKSSKSKPWPGVTKRIQVQEKKSDRPSFCLLCARYCCFLKKPTVKKKGSSHQVFPSCMP